MKVGKLYRGYKYFIGFVEKHEKFPNADELITFYYNRYIEANKCKTLPFLTERWAKDVIEVYRPFFEKLDVKKIIEIFIEFMPIVYRQKAEKEDKKEEPVQKITEVKPAEEKPVEEKKE